MTVQDEEVIRCSARFVDTNGSDNVNVWYFELDLAAPQSDAAVFAAVDAYLTSVYTEFDTEMRSGTGKIDLKVDVVTWQNGKWEVTHNVGLQGWGAGITPSAAGDALPPGVAALGKLYTGAGKHIGKKFFGTLTEAASDVGGNIVGAAATKITTGLTKLLTPYIISAGNVLLATVVDHLTGEKRSVIEIGVGGNFGYQRRRRPGTGS